MNLLLPIAVQVRELDSRLLLAAHAVQRGHTVYLGHLRTIWKLGSQLSPGVYLGFLKPPRQRREHRDDQRRMLARGHRVVFVDESQGIYPGEEADWADKLERRLARRPLRAGDIVTTWGDFQREVYEERFGHREIAVVTTGHPRFDLPALHTFYEADVATLRREHGDFLLVNTNFSDVNPFANLQGLTSRVPASASERARLLRDWSAAGLAFARFVEMIGALAEAFPDVTVIVRPHPREDLGLYYTLLADLPRVLVTREGPANPWILAARALIHDGCTTALEGYIGGVPVISFVPDEPVAGEKALANSFGARCESIDAVVAAAAAALAGAAKPAAGPDPRARRLFHNLTAPLSSCSALLDAAAQARPTTVASELPRRELARLGASFSRAWKTRDLAPRALNAAKWDERHRFGSLERADAGARLRRAARIAGVALRFDALGDHALVVERA